jgi:hypothetical protein
MKLTLTALATLLVLSCTFTNAIGQTKYTDSTAIPKAYWVSAGFGVSALGNIAVMGNANIELDNRWLLTGTAQADAPIFGSITTINTYGLLIGKVYKPHPGLFGLSAGLAVMQVDDKTTIGIPILLQTNLVLLQVLGIGINGFANLNTTTPSAGFDIGIALGRMRTHK